MPDKNNLRMERFILAQCLISEVWQMWGEKEAKRSHAGTWLVLLSSFFFSLGPQPMGWCQGRGIIALPVPGDVMAVLPIHFHRTDRTYWFKHLLSTYCETATRLAVLKSHNVCLQGMYNLGSSDM